eukprot:scaffold587997_cov25-Prasinocladus_malaysianus.AAC.1
MSLVNPSKSSSLSDRPASCWPEVDAEASGKRTRGGSVRGWYTHWPTMPLALVIQATIEN